MFLETYILLVPHLYVPYNLAAMTELYMTAFQNLHMLIWRAFSGSFNAAAKGTKCRYDEMKMLRKRDPSGSNKLREELILHFPSI
jgi:hypothetical protein